MSAETAAILDEAANVIRRNGWYQGFYYGPSASLPPVKRPVCTLGAIYIAMGSSDPRQPTMIGSPAEVALEQYLDAVTVADWNDDPDRTLTEIIAALEGAARAEREAAS